MKKEVILLVFIISTLISGVFAFSSDMKAPRVSSVFPEKGFNSENFILKYSEDNVDVVNLYVDDDLKDIIDLYLNNDLDEPYDGFYGCDSGRNQICELNFDLSEFDGEEISYIIEIIDENGNKGYSRFGKIKVDITDPFIDELSYFIDGRRVSFDISVDEDNLDKIEYYDLLDKNPRWKTLCRTNSCFTTKMFSSGGHDLIVRATDKAGNYAEDSFLLDI